MSKQFYVEPGFLVRVGGLWHDHQAALFVEEDENAEVYLANRGVAGSCLGVYSYARLDQVAPPMGLRCAPRYYDAGCLPYDGARYGT
ncbi:MAG: hypothetical protein KIT36_14535 [Alphaproteobacteria bacterium]|nr:hypothetical protein [Alphaproteobacteria bacterium]